MEWGMGLVVNMVAESYPLCQRPKIAGVEARRLITCLAPLPRAKEQMPPYSKEPPVPSCCWQNAVVAVLLSMVIQAHGQFRIGLSVSTRL